MRLREICKQRKTWTGNKLHTLERSKGWSQTTLPKVYENTVFNRFWNIILCYYNRIIHSKISIWIQENFHYHVPILKSHHDPLPSLQRQFWQDKANQHKEYGTWHMLYETCTKSNKFYHWEGLCAQERLVYMYSEHSKPWKGEITKLGEKWMN